MTFTNLFIVGVVVILVCVMLDEFLETYDEWRNGDDEF